MAADYFNAGSDMVLTASFGGSRFMLDKYGYAGRVREFNRLAATHARTVASPWHFVVGSVGPTGEILQSNGEPHRTARYTKPSLNRLPASKREGPMRSSSRR